MSVTLEKPRLQEQAFPTKGFDIGKKVVTALYYLALVIALCSVVGLVKVALFDRENPDFGSSLLFWIQTAAGYGIYSLVLYQARTIVESSFEFKTPFCNGQGRRLKIVAISFLLLALFGAVFSYACAAVADSLDAIPAFSACLGGFPTYDDWAVAFGQNVAGVHGIDAVVASDEFNVSIDTTSLVIAVFAWMLSCVFDLGERLQQEQDETI